MGDPEEILRLEIVAVGDPRTEMLAILRNYYRRVKEGQVTGIMVLAEMPGGAYRAASVSSTENLAERIGRLRLLRALDLLESELIKEAKE